ncbi:MAG: alpha/beta fold hydrolase [Actinomycetia bacterium]|nr:alpha/beta fold hydrolase [Actinomycetes bacterium]
MSALIPGAEPWSFTPQSSSGSSRFGALVIHGLTSNPDSMRGIAKALAAAGFHVELPLLPGHGTVMEDLVPIRWSDFVTAVEAAYETLAARVDKVVVVGLSLGGALTLRVGANHPEVAGLVCVNPAAEPQAPEIIEMLQGMLDGGTEVMPGIRGDIADPDATESGYDGTSLPTLFSLLVDGLAPLAGEYSGMHMPMLLMNSPQDHVVEPRQSEFLAANYGGPIERISLDRSFHVATLDYDKDLIIEATVAFAQRVTGGA